MIDLIHDLQVYTENGLALVSALCEQRGSDISNRIIAIRCAALVAADKYRAGLIRDLHGSNRGI